MFEAPEVILNIPDIAYIYGINDTQGEELDAAVDQMDSNIFLSDMDEDQIIRWEALLSIVPMTDDTVDDRRFRIMARVLERLPYSYRVIVNKLEDLCPDGVEMVLADDRLSVEIKLSLRSVKMLEDVAEFVERVFPLNMTYSIIILYNTYGLFSTYTHGDLTGYTHGNLRESVFE